MTTMADILRMQNQAAGLQNASAGFSQIGQNPGAFTVGGGNVQAMGGMTSPTPKAINLGAILGGGLGNYLAGTTQAQALQKKQQATEMSQQLMQNAIGNDPEGQRLLQMAVLGVPGADKALANHVEPIKVAMGSFTQYVADPNADPELADQIGIKAGFQPGYGRQAVINAKENRAKTLAAANAQENYNTVLKNVTSPTIGAAQTRAETALDKPFGNTGLTIREYTALSPEERQQAVQRGAMVGKQTQGQKELDKMFVEAKKNAPIHKQAVSTIDQALAMLPQTTFYPGQAGMADPALANNRVNAEFARIITQLQYDALPNHNLGSGFSEGDRKFIERMVVNMERGDKQAVANELNMLRARQQARLEDTEGILQNGSATNIGLPSKPIGAVGSDEEFNSMIQDIQNGR